MERYDNGVFTRRVCVVDLMGDDPVRRNLRSSHRERFGRTQPVRARWHGWYLLARKLRDEQRGVERSGWEECCRWPLWGKTLQRNRVKQRGNPGTGTKADAGKNGGKRDQLIAKKSFSLISGLLVRVANWTDTPAPLPSASYRSAPVVVL